MRQLHDLLGIAWPCRPGEDRDPVPLPLQPRHWTPAFAGLTGGLFRVMRPTNEASSLESVPVQPDPPFQTSGFTPADVLSIRQGRGSAAPVTGDGFRAGMSRGRGFDSVDAAHGADCRPTHLERSACDRALLRRPATSRLVAYHANISPAGFTFVELLVVVAILGILSAIAIPAYRDYLLRSKVAESLVFLGDAKVGINEFYSRWGRMPADNGEAGLRRPDEFRGNYIRSLQVSDGAMVALMDIGKDADGRSFTRTLTFRPWVNTRATGSPVIWTCGRQDPGLGDNYRVHGSVADNAIENALLPSVCRKVD